MFNMAGMQLPDYLKGKDVTEDQSQTEGGDVKDSKDKPKE
jgi:hypothetical protein